MIRFYLENEQLLETDPNKLVGVLFSSIQDIQWWSTEAIKEFISGTYEMLKIYAHEKRLEIEKNKHADRSEKTRLTKFINRDIRIPNNREKLINFYFQQILSSEKKGLLAGFGMEGSLANPEYNTIYKKNEDAEE